MKAKQCTKCKLTFPCTEEYFYKQLIRSKTKGDYYTLSSWCKSCKSKSSLNWQNTNPEAYSENKKKWYLKNEDFRKKQRKKSKTLKMRKHQKEWRKANPEKVNNNSSIYRNKKHKISLREWDACRLYFNYRCAYCAKTWEQNYLETKKDLHKEHVDDEGSNKLDNCVPSCQTCNSSKWKFDFNEWYNSDNPIYSIERYEKIMLWITTDHKSYIKQ